MQGTRRRYRSWLLPGLCGCLLAVCCQAAQAPPAPPSSPDGETLGAGALPPPPDPFDPFDPFNPFNPFGPGGPPFGPGGPPFGPGGPPFGPGGPPFGPGGPGMFGQERKLRRQFDADRNGWLDRGERAAARELLRKEAASNPRPPGFVPPGFGQRAGQAQPRSGIRLTPSQVRQYSSREELYAPGVLRTLFLEFENEDWEAELADFRSTDIEVPATVTADGKRYPGVGARFRGTSSYFMVQPGLKRSFNLSVDTVDSRQRLLGARTLNLLNSSGDPTFLRPMLFSQIAAHYIPVPRVNLVRVVINGESWGLYINQEQFDEDFVARHFRGAGATRWKVPGTPFGGAGLAYEGDDVEAYKRRYEIKGRKGKEADAAWARLVSLCRTLEQTPSGNLAKAIAPLLDVEGVLRYLALENVFLNEDGYWARGSDFSLCLDARGVFHVIPHDFNETFHPAPPFGFGPGGPGFGPGGPGFGPGGPGFGPGGPGFGPGGPGFGPGGPGFGPGGPGGPGVPGGAPGAGPGTRPLPGPGRGGPQGQGGPTLNQGPGIEVPPLAGVGDPRKPLLTKLLAVPAYRERYLQLVRTIAAEWLDWNRIRPLVERHRALVEADVRADTRKLESFEAFQFGLGLLPGHGEEAAPPAGGPLAFMGRRLPSLRGFVESRRRYLLGHSDLKGQAK